VSYGLWKISCGKSRRLFGRAAVAFGTKVERTHMLSISTVLILLLLFVTSGPHSSASSSFLCVHQGESGGAVGERRLLGGPRRDAARGCSHRRPPEQGQGGTHASTTPCVLEDLARAPVGLTSARRRGSPAPKWRSPPRTGGAGPPPAPALWTLGLARPFPSSPRSSKIRNSELTIFTMTKKGACFLESEPAERTGESCSSRASNTESLLAPSR
jgi:hypothetical protein